MPESIEETLKKAQIDISTADGDIIAAKGEIDFLFGEHKRLPIDTESVKNQVEHQIEMNSVQSRKLTQVKGTAAQLESDFFKAQCDYNSIKREVERNEANIAQLEKLVNMRQNQSE